MKLRDYHNENNASGAPDSFDRFTEKVISFMNNLDSPTEEDTKVKVITPVLEELGWSRYSPQFRMEFSPVDPNTHPVDYLLYDSDANPKVCVEAKRWMSNLTQREINQTKTYLRMYNLQYGILTNGYLFFFFSRPDTENLDIPDPAQTKVDEINLDSEFISQFSPRDSDRQEPIPTINTAFNMFFTEDVPDSNQLPKQAITELVNNYLMSKESPSNIFRKWSQSDLPFEQSRINAVREDRSRTPVINGVSVTQEGYKYLPERWKSHPWVEPA